MTLFQVYLGINLHFFLVEVNVNCFLRQSVQNQFNWAQAVNGPFSLLSFSTCFIFPSILSVLCAY